jgi:hypothetical protein
MKIISKLLASLVLATFSLPTTAWAVFNFNFKGEIAVAIFSNTDSSGCLVTNVAVFASENVSQEPPAPGASSSGVSLFISQFDDCTGTPLLAADGSTLLADPDFQVFGQLKAATLNTTVKESPLLLSRDGRGDRGG